MTSNTNTTPVNAADVGIGQITVSAGIALLTTSMALLASCTMVGFWMTLLIALISAIISIIMYFATPFIMAQISDERYAAIGSTVGPAAGWVLKLFAKVGEEDAADVGAFLGAIV